MTSNIIPILTLISDTDCVFYLDGAKQLQLIKGLAHELPLSPGHYTLNFVSVDNSDDSLLKEFEMPAKNKKYNVMFKANSQIKTTGQVDTTVEVDDSSKPTEGEKSSTDGDKVRFCLRDGYKFRESDKFCMICGRKRGEKTK